MTSSLSDAQNAELLHLIIDGIGIIPNDHQIDELQDVLTNLLPSLRNLNYRKANFHR